MYLIKNVTVYNLAYLGIKDILISNKIKIISDKLSFK